MTQGMNWGIFSMLAIIGLVLGGVAAFFIYLARRSAAIAAQAAEPLLPLMDIEHGLE
jgi:maltodextrin utilization protein YvdJ